MSLKSTCDPVISEYQLRKFTDKKAIEASLSRHLWPILGNFIAFPSQLGSLEDQSARVQCNGSKYLLCRENIDINYAFTVDKQHTNE